MTASASAAVVGPRGAKSVVAHPAPTATAAEAPTVTQGDHAMDATPRRGGARPSAAAASDERNIDGSSPSEAPERVPR